MSDVSKRTKNVVNMIVSPKIKQLIKTLDKHLNEEYFDLLPDEKRLISHKLMTMTLDETAKLFMGTQNFNDPNFIYELAINNLTQIKDVFEEIEMYAICSMLRDAIQMLEDDLQKLVGKEL